MTRCRTRPDAFLAIRSPVLTRSRARKLSTLNKNQVRKPLQVLIDKENIIADPTPPSGTKRKRVLEISREELELDGAPQGALFEVEVLRSDQFEPSTDPSHEVQIMVRDVTSSDWALQYNAIDISRRFSIHHSELIAPVLGDIVQPICGAAENLRSVMARNALLALNDMFTHLASHMAPHLQRCLEVLLYRSTSEKRFIRDAAANALTSAATHAPVPVSCELLASSGHKNADVDATVCNFFEACLGTLAVGRVPGSGLPAHITLASASASASAPPSSPAPPTKDGEVPTVPGVVGFIGVVRAGLGWSSCKVGGVGPVPQPTPTSSGSGSGSSSAAATGAPAAASARESAKKVLRRLRVAMGTEAFQEELRCGGLEPSEAETATSLSMPVSKKKSRRAGPGAGSQLGGGGGVFT